MTFRTPGLAASRPGSSFSGRVRKGDVDGLVGAVAEAFGTLKLWSARMFTRPDLPGSVRAIAAVEAADGLAIFDLDDADALKALGLRPSQVVTREREVSRRWALAIHEQGTWGGVRWWLYYEPRWYSYAVWDFAALTVRPGAVRALTIDDPAVLEASEILVMRCPERSRQGCQVSIWSTPRSPGNHAKQLRRSIARCPHTSEAG